MPDCLLLIILIDDSCVGNCKCMIDALHTLTDGLTVRAGGGTYCTYLNDQVTDHAQPHSRSPTPTIPPTQ